MKNLIHVLIRKKRKKMKRKKLISNERVWINVVQRKGRKGKVTRIKCRSEKERKGKVMKI